MLKLLWGRAQIFDVIDEYASWKYQQRPHIAGAQRSLLIRFAKAHGLRRVSDITEQHIMFFVGGELSQYFAQQAVTTLRAFLWYSRNAGYEAIGHNTASRAALRVLEEESKVSENDALPEWKPGVIPATWKKQNLKWEDQLTGPWSKGFTN